MLELLLLNHLFKKGGNNNHTINLFEHIYENGVEGQIFLKGYKKPKWQDETLNYDALTVTINKSHYTIQAFRCPKRPQCCFLQIECPKEWYHRLPENQRINMSKTQDILQSHDLFAPIINSGHFIQIQIPMNEAKYLLVQGLRHDLSKIFPDSTTGILIAFDILFFCLFHYTFFAKPEQQVIHIAKSDVPEIEKVKQIQEILHVINAPPAVLFKKVVEYTNDNHLELPLWLIEQFYQDPELAKDPAILEASYQSFVSILSPEKLKALSWSELHMMATKVVDTLYTYNINDRYSVISQLLTEMAVRLGAQEILLSMHTNVRMNNEALCLFIDVLKGFKKKKENKCKKVKKLIKNNFSSRKR